MYVGVHAYMHITEKYQFYSCIYAYFFANEILYELTTFQATRDSTQIYVSSFLIGALSVRRQNILHPHMYFATLSEILRGFMTSHAK